MENPALLAAADRPMLTQMVGRWPWFAAPRMLLLRLAECEGDALTAERMRAPLALRLMYYPAPPLLLKQPDWDTLRRKGTRRIIDGFLADPSDKRIVPDSPQPAGEEPFAGGDLSHFEIDDDTPVSEALARIYAAQGHTERAAAIYRRLSLKFPEKSVTFAGLIAELTEKK